MMIRRILTAAAGALSLALSAGNAPCQLTVFKDATDPRPVTFTVPARAGEVPTAWQIRSGEKEYPAQSSVAARYPDGSPRWYKLSAHLVPGKITAVPGKSAAKIAFPVKKCGEAAYTNGKWVLRYTLDPFQVEWAENTFAAPELRLPGKAALLPGAATLNVIEAGEIQTILEFSGEYGGAPKGERYFWSVRVTMWSDCGVIGVEPSVAPALAQAGKTVYDEMMTLRSADFTIHTARSGNAFRQVQWEDDAYEENGKAVKGALGIFNYGGISLYVPEMAERFPIGVGGKDKALTVELLPEILPSTRYKARDKEYVRFFALRTGNYVMRAGVQLSYPMLLSTKKIGAAFRTPVAIPDAADLNGTGAWLNEIGAPDALTAPFDKEIRVSFDTYFRHQQGERWYGFLNYGDNHGERIWNWANNEYDNAAPFFEHAIRYNDPKLFREGLRCARHQMEIDTVKHHPGKNNGGVYTHSMGHTGGYYREGEFKFNNYGGGSRLFLQSNLSMGHTRIRGMAMAYVLSGDRRFYDDACATGDFILRNEIFTKRTWRATHREPGWALVNLTSLYWMNGDQRFLKGAEELARIVMEQAKGHGVRYDKLAKHNCPMPEGGWKPEHKQYRTGALSFPTGYQGTGMYLTYNITSDPELKAAIKRNLHETAEYIMARLYFPERKSFVHSPVPWRRQSSRNGTGAMTALRNVLMADMLLSGDRKNFTVVRDTMLYMLEHREVFSSPLKTVKPDDPMPHTLSSAIYFFPLNFELMRKLNVTLPQELHYDLSVKETWGGQVQGITTPDK